MNFSWRQGSVGAIAWFALLIPASSAAQTNPTVPLSPLRTIPDRVTRGEVLTSVKTPRDEILADGVSPGADPENRLLSPFAEHLATDQKQFWMSATHLHTKDLKWILPGAGMTAAFIATDGWWAKQVPSSHVATSKKISDYSTYSLLGLSGGSFLLGQMKHDGHLSEAGLLAGEAAINSTLAAYSFKGMTRRERPYLGNGHGDFFAGGSSFPSEHAALAWSVASVWAHEYPGWLSQIAAYGLASTVTLTRVTARQHFPSDVIVGSALGWYFGRQVYRAHHDPELGGSGWGNFFEETTGDRTRNPSYMASPYVPLDSWIYPAMERLIAMGAIQSGILGIRPWTRMACARLLQDTDQEFSEPEVNAEKPRSAFAALTNEFASELARLDGASNLSANVESVYTRTMMISGTPLRDSFHFGQSLINDYGRPYWTGANSITGMTAEAEAGPVAVYLRGEYQHAPAIPSASTQTLAAIAAADVTPPLPNGAAAASRFELLDSTAAININNVQISIGKQSVWLGPGEGGAWLMSNNAAPFPMVKIDDVVAHELPGLSRILGPFRTEFFVGQLSGQRWEFCAVSSCRLYPGSSETVGPSISPQPFLHGEKISFQPTPNLEFGMGVTAMFGGPGLPVTFGNFFRTYYLHSPTAANNPGKRISAADFTYRLPGLRNWATIYMDSLVVDEISPIGSTRANINPGVYLPRIPMIPRLEFRAEGINESRAHEFPPGFVYADYRRYLSGYTNDGNMLGSWVGRAGRGEQGWLTYWFSARNKLQLSYRAQTVSPNFIGGGRLADYSARGEFMAGSSLSIAAFLQYEQWRFPLLDLNPHKDIAASVQFTFYPHLRLGN